jgi:hypothetical protein
MNTRSIHAGRELTSDELNAVSGGRGLLGTGKDIESQDKLGNFEIQNLMSSYDRAGAIACSVLKKKDDAASSVIGKI